MMDFAIAIALGLAGSLHCAAMCGPLLLALPAPPGGPGRFIAGRVVYQLGRVATYRLLGVAAGGVADGQEDGEGAVLGPAGPRPLGQVTQQGHGEATLGLAKAQRLSGAAAVDRIAQQRVKNMRHVHTDLMGSTGLQ